MSCRTLIPAVLVAALLASGGCRSDDPLEIPRKLAFGEARYALIRPPHWKSMELEEEGDIELGSTRAEGYVLVAVDAAADLPGEANLGAYCENVVESLSTTPPNQLESSEREEIKFHGMDVIKIVVTGRIGGLEQAQGWVVCMKSGDDFIRMVLWSPKSDYDKHLEDFGAIVLSTRKLDD